MKRGRPKDPNYEPEQYIPHRPFDSADYLDAPDLSYGKSREEVGDYEDPSMDPRNREREDPEPEEGEGG